MFVAMTEIEAAIERCREKLTRGVLTEADLTAALETAGRRRRQSLLYIQASSTHPWSRVLGMSVFEPGLDPDGVNAQGEFLYKSLKEALDDGWRIVKFPEMTLAMADQATHGLGLEYILERWR